MVRSICNLRGQLACLLALALALALGLAFGGRPRAVYLYFVLALASTQSKKSLCTARHNQSSVSASRTRAPRTPQKKLRLLPNPYGLLLRKKSSKIKSSFFSTPYSTKRDIRLSLDPPLRWLFGFRLAVGSQRRCACVRGLSRRRYWR